MRTFKNIDDRIEDARREVRRARGRLDKLKSLQKLDDKGLRFFGIDGWGFGRVSYGEDSCWVGDYVHMYDPITGEDEGSQSPFWLMIRGNENDGYIAYYFDTPFSNDLRFPINGTPGDIFHEGDRYTVFSSPAEAALNALDVIDEADQFFEDLEKEGLPFPEDDDRPFLKTYDMQLPEGIDDELPFL